MDNKYIDKIGVVPIDLSKLFHVVDNHVIKKTVYDKLVWKVHAIDSSQLVKKWTVIQKLKKLKIQFPIMINTLLLPNLITLRKKSFDEKLKLTGSAN